jgi:hypothetical protein
LNKVSNWRFCSLLLVLLVFLSVPDFGHTGDLTKDLLEAAKESNLNNLEALISDGADVNSADVASNTPLIIATKFGHIECVKFLLEKRYKNLCFALKKWEIKILWKAGTINPCLSIFAGVDTCNLSI